LVTDLPKVSGYVRFKAGWSEVGFTDHWGVPYTKGTVYIEASPGDPKARSVYMATILTGGPAQKPTVVVKLQEGVVYPFTLEYTPGGYAHATIAGMDLGTLPAPKEELPFNVSNAYYYANWWDVPEYRQAAIGAGVGGVGGVLAGYLITKNPMYALAGIPTALIGAAVGYYTAKP
jgi:hypothetical protein